MQIPIREIDHVVIRCADLEAMVQFYATVLGCPVEKEQRELGLIQMRAGRSLIDLLAVGARIDRPGKRHAGHGEQRGSRVLARRTVRCRRTSGASHGERRASGRRSPPIRR